MPRAAPVQDAIISTRCTTGFGGGRGGGRDDINSIQLAAQDFSNLPPFEKNFYVEHPAVTARSPADVETYRKLREIHVQGTGVPKPCTTFEEASFPGELPPSGMCARVQLAANPKQPPWHKERHTYMMQLTAKPQPSHKETPYIHDACRGVPA